MTYTDYVQSYLQHQDYGIPIYTDEIAEAVAADYGIEKKNASAATAVAVKRIIDGDKLPDLRCYQKGIYYRTTNTPFGEIGINREKLIARKYLDFDNGYETGLRLLHHLGLTTQMPNEHLLATNAAKDCIRYDKKLVLRHSGRFRRRRSGAADMWLPPWKRPSGRWLPRIPSRRRC